MAINYSYKRTVYCSYCHEKGHNKSSCPKYAERIENLRAEHGSDHYLVQSYDAKKARRKAGAKNRSCSYCDTKGHNRATCPELKAHIAKSQAKNAEYRQKVYEFMKESGLGVGAIVESDKFRCRVDVDDHMSPIYRTPHVITKIQWENISFFNRDYSWFDNNEPILSKPLCDIQYQWHSCPGYFWHDGLAKLLMGEEVAKQWIDGTHWRADEKYRYFCQVVSPTPTPEPPSSWLKGGDVKYWKKAYKKHKSFMGPMGGE